MIRILSWKVLGTVTWSFAPTKQWQGIQFALPSLRTKGRSCFSNLPVPWATWCMDDGNKSMQPFLAQEKYYEGLSAGGIYWSTSVDKRYSRYKCSTKIKSPLRFKKILRTLLKLLFRFLRYLSIWYDLIWFDMIWWILDFRDDFREGYLGFPEDVDTQFVQRPRCLWTGARLIKVDCYPNIDRCQYWIQEKLGMLCSSGFINASQEDIVSHPFVIWTQFVFNVFCFWLLLAIQIWWIQFRNKQTTLQVVANRRKYSTSHREALILMSTSRSCCKKHGIFPVDSSNICRCEAFVDVPFVQRNICFYNVLQTSNQTCRLVDSVEQWHQIPSKSI